MDELPVKHPKPFSQKSALPCKATTFYLKLLLLLGNVMHNQSSLQHCPIRTAVSVLPNFTSEAGRAFFFKLPLPAAHGHMRHYQVSQADGNGTLPHWMVFRHQTNSLAGLALTEDCGIYHLKVFATSDKCAIYFDLHIRYGTVTGKDPARDASLFSERKTTIWANLLLRLNPETLNASQRVHLVTTVSGYFLQPLRFIYLFSRRESFTLQQENLRVCRRGGLAAKQDATGDVVELLWPVGCRGDERWSGLAKVLEHSVKTGLLEQWLRANILGWRVLCTAAAVQKKVKRQLKMSKFTPTSDRIVLPHSLTDLEPLASTILVHMNHIEANPSPFSFRNFVDATFVGELSAATFSTLLPSSTPLIIYPSVPLTSAATSVTSTLTHVAGDTVSLPTRLTPRPHQKETPRWTGSYRASHTDSETQSRLSSQERPKDAHLNPGLKTIQSPPSSVITPTTCLPPDVSQPSHLETEQLSISQHFHTISDLSQASTVMNQDVMSHLNETTPDASLTTSAGQLTLSGKAELEPSLSTSLPDSPKPSVTTFTPALPSEPGLLSVETPNITILFTLFSEESLKKSSSLMALLQTFSKSSLVDTSASSLQLVNQDFTDLQSLPHFYQNELTQTLSSDPFLLQKYPSALLQESLPLTERLQISSPSTGQAPYTTHSIPQMQSLDPSFPFHESSSENDQFQVFLTSYLQDETQWTAFSSVFFMLDSSGQFLSTQTLMGYFSLSPTGLSSDVLKDQAESNESMSLLMPTTMIQEISHISATQQVAVLDTLPPIKVSGFPVITYSLAPSTSINGSRFSVRNSMSTRQSPATGSRSVTNVLSTWPILKTSDGMSTTSLLALAISSSKRQSTNQLSSSSASVSSFINLPPKVLHSIPALMATVGFPFRYSIPPKTFLDPEDGEADALSLELRLIDGPPVNVGSWLSMDGLELHGVPLEVDLWFTPQHLLLAARDRQGLSTWLPLTLVLRRNPVRPCHVFTLTAQRSLRSILRHRRRVELLLRKLSGFFGSSSSHHLSIVSMSPGSTVVSWYNYSLCAMGDNRITQCLVDEIQRMGLAMRSVEGGVNPAFREAMLPEFPITKVESVSYRHDCLSTATTLSDGLTPVVSTTLNPGTNTSLSPTSNTCVSGPTATTTTARQVNSYQWMAAMFTAVFVVCLLILIIVLIAVVLYFCRGRSRIVAIWPTQSLPSFQSIDLRAIRPRLPPVFQPEVPPPPLRLWINLSQRDTELVPSACEQQRKTVDEAL